MKKILILLAMLPFTLLAQPPGYPYTDTIDVAAIPGTDTVIYIKFWTPECNSIEFNYTNFDQDDATIDVGYTNWGSTFNTVDATVFPFTLDATTNTDAVTSTATLMIVGDNWRAAKMAIKISKGTVTTADLIYKIVRE